MAYVRVFVVDSSPGGDTVKAAVATKLDGDLTNAFTYLNAHDIATTGVHGAGASTVATAATLATHAALITGVHGLVITAGKTLTLTGSLTLTATDGSTLAIGTGGTLGTAAYTAATAYDAAGAAAAVTPTTLGLVIGTNVQAYNSNLTGINQALTTTSSPSFTTVTAALTGVASGNALLAASISDGDTTHAPDGNSVFDALALKMALTGSNLAIGSDADGDMYYRASSVLARLAKGAANLRLFMNAGATAPEWAKGMIIIEAERDLAAATGDVAYTGAGFKPNAVIMLVSSNAAHSYLSVGFYDGITNSCIALANAGALSMGTTGVIVRIILTWDTSMQSAIVKSLDADGFTLTWTKAGTPTGTARCTFLCLR